jgi:hypothetical protein
MVENGWDEWGKHVIHELERLSLCIGELRKDMNDCKMCHTSSQTLLRERISSLEIKSSIWGMMGGVLATLAAYLIKGN